MENSKVKELTLFKDLANNLFNGDIDLFLQWCHYEYKDYCSQATAAPKELCIHSRHNILDVACLVFGTCDTQKKKYMVKKSTLYGNAKRWYTAKVGRTTYEPPIVSTKIPSYHLSFFASLYKKEKNEIQTILDSPGLIRHLCGCFCCSADHLKAGTNDENIKDLAYHTVRNLECTSSERYFQFREFAMNKPDSSLII